MENVGCMGEKRNAHWLLVVKPEGNRPLGRPTRSVWKLKIHHV